MINIVLNHREAARQALAHLKELGHSRIAFIKGQEFSSDTHVRWNAIVEAAKELGIAIDLFTPIFAVSRVSGWTAHVLEQYANNRLIRPRADYIGPEYPQRFVPLEAR